ncbi:MAG: YceI family protein [Myxococcales bacterium]|nr:YceI family protein [Myxococcales bacterium]
MDTRSLSSLAALGLFLLHCLVPESASAEADVYDLVDGSVRFTCEGDKVVVPAWGKFGAVSSHVRADPADIAKTKGHVEVLLSSVNTEDSGWDDAFRRAEFLGIEEHPKARFAIRRIEGVKDFRPNRWNHVLLVGQFSLHGIEREVSVPAGIRWTKASKGKAEELYVRAYLHITWDQYEIPVPGGITRTFAGSGARIQVELKYQRKASAQKGHKP